MKKLIYLFVMAILVSGCATYSGFIARNRENLMKLSIGMNKQEVLNIMGTNSERVDFGTFKVTNPYRSEIMQGKDKTFEILYYYTDCKALDGAITDDELTPLVFDNGKLIGWGNSFLQSNIQKYEIRIR